MGYTTIYSGSITVDPPMDWKMRGAIREYCANADIGKVGKNLNLDGTCDWKPSDTGFSDIVHNGMEKSYDQDQWLQALINDLLKPAGYVCNGIIDCQCDDTRWRIYVRDNEVTVADLAPGAVWDDKPEPSYAEQVNAPWSEEAVEALNKELASDNPAKFKRAVHSRWMTSREKLRDNPEALAVYNQAAEAFKRGYVPLETLREILDAGVAGDDKKLEELCRQIPPVPAVTPEDADLFTAAQADEALEALRTKLRQVPSEPQPAQPLSSVGDALKDLGNAIAFKAAQGVDAVAGFVIDVEGALELCAEQGDTRPLDALFKSLRAEHDAEAEQAEQSAAVDDDIPNDSKDTDAAVEAWEESLLDDDNLKTWEPRAIREPGPQDFAAGDPSQWNDTALNGNWLIWSNKHGLWWMPNSVGYTEHTLVAGRYTFDQAVEIVKKSCQGWNWSQSNTPPTTMVPDPDRD